MVISLKFSKTLKNKVKYFFLFQGRRLYQPTTPAMGSLLEDSPLKTTPLSAPSPSPGRLATSPALSTFTWTGAEPSPTTSTLPGTSSRSLAPHSPHGKAWTPPLMSSSWWPATCRRRFLTTWRRKRPWAYSQRRRSWSCTRSTLTWPTLSAAPPAQVSLYLVLTGHSLKAHYFVWA